MTWLRTQRAAKASPARSFGARGPFPVISATLSIRKIASATTCRRTWAHVCEACRTPPTRATATSTLMANALAAVCCLLRVPEISRGPLVQAGKSTVVSRRDPPPRSLPPRARRWTGYLVFLETSPVWEAARLRLTHHSWIQLKKFRFPL